MEWFTSLDPEAPAQVGINPELVAGITEGAVVGGQRQGTVIWLADGRAVEVMESWESVAIQLEDVPLGDGGDR